MKWMSRRKKRARTTEALKAIHEARERADDTKRILQEDHRISRDEAVMAEKLNRQYRSNGFAEIIEAVYSGRGS